MARIRVFAKNNSIYVAGKSYPAGTIEATNSGDLISIKRSDNNKLIVKNVDYSRLLDKDGQTWGGTVSTAVSALNSYINEENPDKTIVADDKNNFIGKAGYTVIVAQGDETMTSSSKLLFTGSDLSLGTNLNVKNFDITTTTANGEIRITPNGTGSVNLDGTVQFKRFDTTDPANIPTAAPGKMYADQNDNLFFGVS